MSGTRFLPEISQAKSPSLQLHVEEEMETGKTYRSYFRTITQLSLHTLHLVVTWSLFEGTRGAGGG